MLSVRSVSKHIAYRPRYLSLAHHFHPSTISCRFTSTSSSTTSNWSALSAYINSADQRILNLFYGFFGGIAFTALYNREWPGYERRIRRRARKGYAEAQVEYAEFLLSKKDDKPNERYKARAFQLLQQASEQGNKTAHYYLGEMHKRQVIEAPNPKAAFHHFTVAANTFDEGDPDNRSQVKTITETLRLQSQFEVALCHLEGYGADRDVKIGLGILEGIGKENGDAAYTLSQIYANGRYGVSVNSIKGLSWKKEAAKLGHKLANDEMMELYVSKGRDLVDDEVPNIDAYAGIPTAL